MKTIAALIMGVLTVGGANADDYLGWIVFDSSRDGNVNIWKMREDGSQQTRLTTDTANESNPAFSPYGDRIAYVSQVTGSNQIFVMNADGSNKHQITFGSGSVGDPSWSPDGSKIVFSSNEGSGNWEVCTVAANGSGKVNLTNSDGLDMSPCFSPDGSKIAFVSNRPGSGSYDIYVMDANGANVLQLTTNPDIDKDPAWSRSGQKIAYSSEYPGFQNLFVMNADGSNKDHLTFNLNDTGPEWNADDSVIVFNAPGPAGPDIYAMAANGTNQVRLTFDPASDQNPSMPWRSPFAMVPDTATVQPGMVLAGGLFDLGLPDDSYLYARPGAVLVSSQVPLQVVLETNAAVTTPSQMRFSIEAAGSVGGVVRQRVWLYDFVAGSYVLMRTDVLGGNDTVYPIMVFDTPSRFVSGSGRLRAKVDYKATGPVLVYPWFTRLDHAQWLEYP